MSSDAVSASYAAEGVREIKKLKAALAEHTASILAAIEARDAPRKSDPRMELLIEVAGYIAELEEGLASDRSRTSGRAQKLRRLIAEVSARTLGPDI